MRTRWNKVACTKRQQRNMKPDYKDLILNPIPMKKIRIQVSSRAVVKTVTSLLLKKNLSCHKKK